MRASDGPPTGWVPRGGVLEPGEQVVAYGARGQGVVGLCNAQGCKRRVELDPKELAGRGMALLTMKQVQGLYRCQRLDHCNLDFQNGPMANPLQLDDFVGRPNVRVRLRCQSGRCTFFRVWIVEQMIAGLLRTGKGSGRTQIDQLGKLMTAPCPTCKKAAWTADILWADTDTMGWKAMGERTFAGMEQGGDV